MQLLRYERRGTEVYMDGERIGTCSTPEAADQIVNAVNAECNRIEVAAKPRGRTEAEQELGELPRESYSACVLGEPMNHGPQLYRWCATHDCLMLMCEGVKP